MPRRVREVRDMEIDEVSLVDRPANQFAKVALAKRAPEEEAMPEYIDESGAPVDFEQLEFGSVVYDEAGNAFEWLPETDEAEEPEFATVGKSLADQVREDLSKALSDVERNEAISKAMAEVSKAEQRAAAAEAVAKSERDLRLTREYISKAAEYNVPVAPEELGPVLMRMAESMSYDDCAVIHKCLTASGEIIFNEIGYAGGGDNADIMSMVDAAIGETVAKSASELSKEQLITKAFENDDALYAQYLAERGNH